MMLRAAMPVAIWAAHLGVIYGFAGLACARQWQAHIPWVVGIASALALVLLGALALRAAFRSRRSATLPDFLATGMAGLAALGVGWEASSIGWVPACA